MNQEHNSPQSENELIAQFMGLTLENQDKYGYCGHWNGRTDGKIWVNCGIPDVHIPYDRNWEYLMPVIQKIYALYDEFDFTSIEQENMFLNVLDNYVKYPLSQHYYHVVEFIKWYNNQQPK